MELADNPDCQLLTKLTGVNSVYIIEAVTGIGLIVLVVGKDINIFMFVSCNSFSCFICFLHYASAYTVKHWYMYLPFNNSEGKDREVVLLEKRSVEQCLARSSSSGQYKVSLHPKHIQGAINCTTLAVSTQSDGIYMCVATAEKVLLYKYNNRKEEFLLKKVSLVKQVF